MDKGFIKGFSSAFSRSNVPIMLVDNSYNIIWKNNESILSTLTSDNISSFIEKDTKELSYIVSACIGGRKMSLNVTRVFEEDKATGFVVRAIKAEEVKSLITNTEYINYQLSICAKIRAHVSGIVSTISLLHSFMEKDEMYEGLAILNNQVNYCYKILASIANPIEATKYDIGIYNISRINISCFINNVSGYISDLLRKSNGRIVFETEDDIYINTDHDRFFIMFLNLIINGIEHNISEDKLIQITLKKCEGYAVLSIKDNGLGLPQEKINKAFAAGNTSCCRNQDEGSFDNNDGLGLIILDRFCKTFDCNVFFSSKEHEGTMVSLKMPFGEDESLPEYVCSNAIDYMTNRFSNLYILLSKVCEINYIG